MSDLGPLLLDIWRMISRHLTLAETLERAAAYADAGAHSLFVPGPSDKELIAEICERSQLPVNILMLPGTPDWPVLAEAGVARVSWGAGPWRKAMTALTEDAKALYR